MKPEWLKRRLRLSQLMPLNKMHELFQRYRLNTVCQRALCPNQGECFAEGTATFLILGKTCTRTCTFCAIPTEERPPAPDPEESQRIAQAAAELRLKHVVITSVTRDDLLDGGASQFARTVGAIREINPEIIVEVLIPDFQGSVEALRKVMESGPAILNHNLETVPRLYQHLRPQAAYSRSIELLKRAQEIAPGTITKSGLMLGLGEEKSEVLRVMSNLREVSCDFLTMGQYLRPSVRHHPVVRYVPPEEFEQLRVEGEKMGFQAVYSAPLVRSSFHAAEIFQRRFRITYYKERSEGQCCPNE